MKSPEISRITAKKAPKISKAEADKIVAKRRERDAEMVTGIFKNLEHPSGNGCLGGVAFSYKAYKGDDLINYEFFDGERYTIPHGVARHLNNNCFYLEYQQLPEEYGKEIQAANNADGRLKTRNMQVAKKIHRFAFHSLEYMDDDEMTPVDIVEVTSTL